MSETTDALHAINVRMEKLVERSTEIDLLGRVEYDNIDFDRPTKPPRIRWTILPGEATRRELGNGLTTRRTPGVAIAQVFTVAGQGTKLSGEIVSLLLTVFDPRETVDGVNYRTPYETRVGRSEGEFQVNVTCPFWIDEVN